MKKNFYPKQEYYRKLLDRTGAKKGSSKLIKKILSKSLNLNFIDLEELAILIANLKENREKYIKAAKEITDKVFGKRVEIFIPLYYSNVCINKCKYCGFAANRKIEQKRLTTKKFIDEIRELRRRGFTGVEIVSAQDPFFSSEKVANLIKLAKKEGVRAVFSNIGVFEREKDYLILKEAGLNAWILFQETYDPELYKIYHPLDSHKGNFKLRLNSYELAAESGIKMIGLGSLLGLSDWRYELMAIIDHASYIKEKYGSIISFSVPRLQPIKEIDISENPPYKSIDREFIDYIALLRIAFPFGMIGISTRETKEMRKRAMSISGTSTSAESSTSVGGYSDSFCHDTTQFPTHFISLKETIEDIFLVGKVPSFCTACSELEINTRDWYKLAKKGKLKEGCTKNAIITYGEYCCKGNLSNKEHFIFDFTKRE